MIALLLLGCPYVTDDDHAARLAGLAVPIDPQVDAIDGDLLPRCPVDMAFRVHGTVAGAWGDRDLEAQLAIDEQPFVGAGTVHTAAAAAGRAQFAAVLPLALLDVPPCEDGTCKHALTVSLRDDANEGNVTVADAIVQTGTDPWLIEAYVDGDAGPTPLSEVRLGDNPAISLTIGEWPLLSAAFGDTWTALGGDPSAYYAVFTQCPDGGTPGDLGCVSVEAMPTSAAFGSDFAFEVGTFEFSAATCGDPVLPAGDFYVDLHDRSCVAKWRFALQPQLAYRFVDRDCDQDGLDASPDDCDDGDASVYFGAPGEVACDGVDQNCDGTDTDGPGAVLMYADEDGDTYGTGDGVFQCESWHPGYAPKDGDCDDDDAAIFPSAIDVPADGTDSDCDGADD